MIPSVVFFLVIVTGITTTDAVVTNEDIRVAILQIVNVVRSTDSKLERHEYRDRAVSEQLKKGLVNIDKRIKLLDPLKGTVGRLDERLAAVETILMQTNEREKMQLQRTYEAVIDIQKNLPVIMEEMKDEIISKISSQEPPAQITEPVMSKKDFEKMEKEVMNKIDKVTNTIGKIESEMSKIKADNQQVKDLHNKSSDNLEKLKRHFNDNQQLLTKYDKKLSDFNSKSSNKDNDDWKNNIAKVLDGQKSSIKDILQDLKTLHNEVKQLPQKDGINKIMDSTKNCQDPALKQALHTIESKVNKSHDETTKNLKGLTGLTNAVIKNVTDTLKHALNQREQFRDVMGSLKDLHKEVEKLPQKDAVNKMLNSNCQDPSLKQALNKIESNLNNSHHEVMENVLGTLKFTKQVIGGLDDTKNVVNSQKSNAQDILQTVKSIQNQLHKLPQIEEIATGQRNAITRVEDTIKNINVLKDLTNNIAKECGKTNYGLDSQRPHLQEILQIIKNFQKELQNISQIDELKNGQRTAIIKLDDTAKNIHGLTEVTATLMKSVANTNNALDAQKLNVDEALNDIKNLQNKLQKLSQIDQLSNEQRIALNKIDDALKNINGLTDITGTIMRSSANANTALENQKTDMKEIIRNINHLQDKVNYLPQKTEVSKKLEEVCASRSSISLEDIKGAINEIKNSIGRNQNYTERNLKNITDITGNLMKNVATNYAFNGQPSDVKEILIDVKDLRTRMNQLPQNYDLALHNNSTLQKLEKISAEVSTCKDESNDEIRHILESIRNNINQSHGDTIEKLNDLSEITGNLGESFVTNYGKIRNDIQGLNRIDKVMIQTADSVIETKRKVEFGIQQILAEISKYSKDTTKNVQKVVNNRLDSFETTILDPDTGALANATSTIEEDIQQVWRQIGIMHQQMSNNADALKDLQNHTEAYITGSLGTMNNMKGKVGQITGRITEVDENLNYLLGKLSLVSDEFNRIKTGLSTTFEKIKESFQEVQEKMNEGPGPHKIDSNEEVPPA